MEDGVKRVGNDRVESESKPCWVALAELVPAMPEDAPAIAALAAEIWPTAYSAILTSDQIDYMLGWMYDPDRLAGEMCGGLAYRWIEWESRRCGFVAYGPVESDGDCPLHKFYLLPDCQGRGIGSAAMLALLGEMRRAGVRSCRLRVNRHNAAVHFYKKHGFAIESEDCRDIGGGFVMDDFVMVRAME